MSQELSTIEDDDEAVRATLAEQALTAITDLILSGELSLGSVVNEAELARRLNMSRGPIREAIRRLQGRNLVVRRPYQKARVIDFGLREIREIFELREALEGVACRLATQVMSDAELQKLADGIDAARLSNTRPSLDLHAEIARRCGNERVMNLLLNDLYYLLALYRRRAGDLPGRRPQAQGEHWQIVRAMMSRDAELAESLMRAHVRRATEHLTATTDH